MDVICIYCENGTVLDEPLRKFTVSNIRAVDAALAPQLTRWPMLRKSYSEIDQTSGFANHCPRCGAMQEDMYLQSEPDQPFFGIPRAAHGVVRLIPLVGRVRLRGDEDLRAAAARLSSVLQVGHEEVTMGLQHVLAELLRKCRLGLSV